MNKEIIKSFIQECKEITFKVGQSEEMKIIEEEIEYCKEFVHNKISENYLIKNLSYLGCPNIEKEDCTDMSCEQCWKDYFANKERNNEKA